MKNRLHDPLDIANRTARFFGIPRKAFLVGLFLAIGSFQLSSSYVWGAKIFGIWWVLCFALTYKDVKLPQILLNQFCRRSWYDAGRWEP